jgi:hypothetical protein
MVLASQTANQAESEKEFWWNIFEHGKEGF